MRDFSLLSAFQDRAAPERARPPIALSRRALVGSAAAMVLVAGWAAATTWYIVSRDELAQRFFALETEMKFSYEDRIAALQARLEREVTGNLVERTSFDRRVEALTARQGEIEARQTWLRGAAERVGASGAASTAPRPDTSARAPSPAKLETPVRPEPLPDGAGLRLRVDEPSAQADGQRRPDRLSTIESSLARVAADEVRLVSGLGRFARERATRLRSAIDATGVDVPPGRAAAQAGIGGPLVALPPEARGGQHGFAIADLDLSFGELVRLQDTARALPLGSPLGGEAEQTSGFGYRLDPFTRGPALHTGLDFRAESGTPAHATASGRVVTAEYSGGYGLMVEIDHGSGVASRYGHLSAASVLPGERVEAGQVIGRTGSTGRSTGAHLHYETRINGEPVNPIRFLQAGRLIRRADG